MNNKLIDETIAKTINESCCPLCNGNFGGLVIQCVSCKKWCHFKCTKLPSYQLYLFDNTSRNFTCEICVSVPDTFLDNLVATGSLAECHFLAEKSLELLIGETNSPEKVLCKDASTECSFSTLTQENTASSKNGGKNQKNEDSQPQSTCESFSEILETFQTVTIRSLETLFMTSIEKINAVYTNSKETKLEEDIKSLAKN